MRRTLRQSVRTQYNFRCGYCGVSETNMGAEMTIDHFMPRVQGGDDSLPNLVYCCHACNEFKGDYWHVEPDTSLLHPLLDNMGDHYVLQEDGRFIASTTRGQNHLNVLHLNRPELIAFRLEQQEITLLRQRNQELRQLLEEVQQITQNLEAELRATVLGIGMEENQ
jgi:hypothetical protein